MSMCSISGILKQKPLKMLYILYAMYEYIVQVYKLRY